MRAKLKRKEEAGAAPGSGTAAVVNLLGRCGSDSAIGIPRDETDYHRMVVSIKMNRAYTFVSHSFSKLASPS